MLIRIEKHPICLHQLHHNDDKFTIFSCVCFSHSSFNPIWFIFLPITGKKGHCTTNNFDVYFYVHTALFILQGLISSILPPCEASKTLSSKFPRHFWLSFNKNYFLNLMRWIRPRMCVKYFLSFPQKHLSPEKTETN